MGEPKAGEHIGAGTLAQTDYVFDVKEIQNGHQILAEGLQRWERETVRNQERNGLASRKSPDGGGGESAFYLSGRACALSAWPGTSTWMKHDRSFISDMHGLFTNS